MTAADQRIARLRELEAKASPAPWHIDDIGSRSPRLFIVTDKATSHVGEARDQSDIELIAEMRNALPALLDEITELRAYQADSADRFAAVVRQRDEVAQLAKDLLDKLGASQARTKIAQDGQASMIELAERNGDRAEKVMAELATLRASHALLAKRAEAYLAECEAWRAVEAETCAIENALSDPDDGLQMALAVARAASDAVRAGEG